MRNRRPAGKSSRKQFGRSANRTNKANVTNRPMRGGGRL
jgi:hypothetical protein